MLAVAYNTRCARFSIRKKTGLVTESIGYGNDGISFHVKIVTVSLNHHLYLCFICFKRNQLEVIHVTNAHFKYTASAKRT